MRHPNGYGTIRKLSGKRKRPYGVYITTGFDVAPTVPEIGFLKDILTSELYQQVSQQYEAYKESQMPKARQTQQCIGYYETRTDAMIALAEYNKSPFDIDAMHLTFGQLYDILYDKSIRNMGKSSKTAYVTAYKKCELLRDMRIREIRLSHLQSVVDQYSNKSKSTQNNIIVLFHAIYAICMENDYIEKDYSQFVKITSKANKKKKLPFERQEVQMVWDNKDWIQTTSKETKLTGMPMMDSVLVMLYTGVRINELLSIKVDDVHLEERWIDIQGTKTKAARRAVPIHKKILPLLEARLKNCKSKYLFHDNEGNKLTYSRYMDNFYKPFMDRFNIERTPHECRHTFATIAAASDMNVTLKKKIIGHASADITEDTYTHAYIKDLIAEIDKYDL